MPAQTHYTHRFYLVVCSTVINEQMPGEWTFQMKNQIKLDDVKTTAQTGMIIKQTLIEVQERDA